MQLPLRTFWLYSKNVDRLSAERDLRLLQVMAAAQSSEAYGKTYERLEKQMGEVVRFSGSNGTQEEELDRAGLAQLKAMAW